MDEEKIEREGWRQASITGGQHLLDRMVGMYKELGFDVYLEEVKPDECSTCTLCYQAGNETIYRIYTRPKVEEETS